MTTVPTYLEIVIKYSFRENIRSHEPVSIFPVSVATTGATPVALRSAPRGGSLGRMVFFR